MISSFVFATWIVQFLYFKSKISIKVQASSHLLGLYSSVCVRHVPKPHCWFSHDTTQIFIAEQLKTNERTLRKTTRDLERDRNKMEREEKKLVCEIGCLDMSHYQPYHDKTNHLGFRPDLTQSDPYSRRRLEVF